MRILCLHGRGSNNEVCTSSMVDNRYVTNDLLSRYSSFKPVLLVGLHCDN